MISNLIGGLKAYLEAYEVISRLKLWRFFMIPMLISVVVFLRAVVFCERASVCVCVCVSERARGFLEKRL